MTRPRGLVPLFATLGALLAVMAAPEAKAGTYEITVSIFDVTTSTSYTYTPILDNGPKDGNSVVGQITSNATATTANSGVTLNLVSSTASSAESATLFTQATASVTGRSGAGLSDTYLVTVTTTNTGFTAPPAGPALVAQSLSTNYTYTTGTPGDKDTLTSYYDPTNTPNATSPFSPPTQTSPELATGAVPAPGTTTPVPATTTVGSGVYTTPYALTDIITIQITGSGTDGAQSATHQASASLTVSAAVPEPASLVMMLTGMPVPLMVLGILRRRKARAKN